MCSLIHGAYFLGEGANAEINKLNPFGHGERYQQVGSMVRVIAAAQQVRATDQHQPIGPSFLVTHAKKTF